MSGALATGAHWLALALMSVATASALGAIVSRSLFAMCLHLATASALAAASLLMLGAGEGALAIVIVGVGWSTILMFAAMLLSARATKSASRRRPWLSITVAAATAGAILWCLRDLGAGLPTRGTAAGLGFWLAPLLMAAAAACVGLLGYGERGALERAAPGRET